MEACTSAIVPRPANVSAPAVRPAEPANSPSLTLARIVAVLVREGQQLQDADNRDNDHQFDKGETLLDAFHLILLCQKECL